ncbi:MAG: MarR family transcriptional regulator [Candidatus Micrarchaeia archaeon]
MDSIAEDAVLLMRIFFLMRMRDKGVKPPPYDPEYWMMWLLDHEELPMSEIGRRLHRSKPSMTALVDKLISQGMVRRKPDKDDRRVVRIAMTEMGKRHMRGRREQAKQSFIRSLSRLDEKDCARLGESLAEVNRIVSKIRSD